METKTQDDVQLDAVLPALKSCPLFQALKDEHFSQILKISDVVRFAGEEVMVAEGTDADAFYVIIEGEATIRLSSPAGDDIDIGNIPTGASFGEVGLLICAKLLSRGTASVTPYLDTLTTVLSLCAQWMMAKKLFECWWVWIAVDVIYVPWFIYHGHLPTAGLYALFLCLAIMGNIEWRKSLKRTAMQPA